MFIKAIETVTSFTRPILSISRNYKSDVVQSGAATLFFINSDGWAFTCNHVAKQLIVANELGKKRKAFTDELNALSGTKKKKQILKNLESKYGFNKNSTYELSSRFLNCIEGKLDADIKLHKTLDVALIHFKSFSKLLCTSFPVFPKNDTDLKQGKFICRLGFPFTEFTNFTYDSSTDKILWTSTGRQDTPIFPIEGMVTRNLIDSGKIVGFELSTPGLRGQSGGPAFDFDGKIWGIQASTAHLDLNFDINQDVMRKGKKKKISDHAFLNVGHCIHVKILKEFMKAHNVIFKEE
jgi:hypothetical protein